MARKKIIQTQEKKRQVKLINKTLANSGYKWKHIADFCNIHQSTLRNMLILKKNMPEVHKNALVSFILHNINSDFVVENELVA